MAVTVLKRALKKINDVYWYTLSVIYMGSVNECLWCMDTLLELQAIYSQPIHRNAKRVAFSTRKTSFVNRYLLEEKKNHALRVTFRKQDGLNK
jgi:hypothetical protein